MAYIPLSDDAQEPKETTSSAPKEPLIRVHPGEQLAPGANERCPVCGQPYAQGGVPLASDRQAPAAAQTEAADQQFVIRCAHCGTLSVGVLRPSPNSPESR